MTKSIKAVARELAEAHVREDSETTAVYLARDGEEKEIRLVEVSRAVATSGEVLPFRFKARPDLGVPYASVIVVLSEDEWGRVEAGALELPSGWGANELEAIWPKSA